MNAIGTSQYWKSTAIILLWDDWGGWYDPVPPRQINYTSLGMRIPMILISPYAKPHYISETSYNYGSILRFIEETFHLGSLGTTDATANSLSDSFDFSQPPNAFAPAPWPPRARCKSASSPSDVIQEIIEHDGGVPEWTLHGDLWQLRSGSTGSVVGTIKIDGGNTLLVPQGGKHTKGFAGRVRTYITERLPSS